MIKKNINSILLKYAVQTCIIVLIFAMQTGLFQNAFYVHAKASETASRPNTDPLKGSLKSVIRNHIKPSEMAPAYYGLFLKNILVGAITIIHKQDQSRWVSIKELALIDPFKGTRVSRTVTFSDLQLEPLSYMIRRFEEGKVTYTEIGKVMDGGMISVKKEGPNGKSLMPGIYQFPGPCVFDDLLSTSLCALAPKLKEQRTVRIFDLNKRGVYPVTTRYDKQIKGSALKDPVWEVLREGFMHRLEKVKLNKYHYPVFFEARGFQMRLSNVDVRPMIPETGFSNEQFIKVTSRKTKKDIMPNLKNKSKAEWFLETKGLPLDKLIDDSAIQSITWLDKSKTKAKLDVLIPALKKGGSGSRFIFDNISATIARASIEGYSKTSTYKARPVVNAVTGVGILFEGLPESFRMDSRPAGKTGEKALKDLDKPEKWSAPSTYAQSNDPNIIRFANQTKGKSRGFIPICRKVIQAVKQRVASQSGIGFRSASQVMVNPYGDCTERSVLTVAMLRALRISARAVYGMVYDKGKFYHHMWVEAFDGKDWIPGDPNFGQFPANAGRIRFLPVSLESNDYSMTARLLMSKFGKLTISTD